MRLSSGTLSLSHRFGEGGRRDGREGGKGCSMQVQQK